MLRSTSARSGADLARNVGEHRDRPDADHLVHDRGERDPAAPAIFAAAATRRRSQITRSRSRCPLPWSDTGNPAAHVGAGPSGGCVDAGISVFASTVSAPPACACSRISVLSLSESTTPTVRKYAPPMITESSGTGPARAPVRAHQVGEVSQAFAAVQRRCSSVIRSAVLATSKPPDSVNTPSCLYCSVLSLVSSIIIFE